jgi:uncharacterized membrane protein
VLIYFIHHVSIAIQAPHVIAAVTAELHRGITALPGHFAGRDATREEAEEIEAEVRGLLVQDSATVESRREGYILAVDQGRLMELACDHDVLIRLPARPGQYLQRGQALAIVAPAERFTESLGEEIGTRSRSDRTGPRSRTWSSPSTSSRRSRSARFRRGSTIRTPPRAAWTIWAPGCCTS